MGYETRTDEGFFKHLAECGEDGTMLLRAVLALLFLGGIVYALLSGNWGIGAIVFSIGVVVLGMDRLHAAQSRPERSIGWVLVLCGSLSALFFAFRIAIGAI